MDRSAYWILKVHGGTYGVMRFTKYSRARLSCFYVRRSTLKSALALIGSQGEEARTGVICAAVVWRNCSIFSRRQVSRVELPKAWINVSASAWDTNKVKICHPVTLLLWLVKARSASNVNFFTVHHHLMRNYQVVQGCGCNLILSSIKTFPPPQYGI